MDLPTRTSLQPTTAEMPHIQWIAILGLFLLAGLIRFSYVNSVVIDSPWRADAGKYVTLSVNMVAHATYSLARDAPFTPTHYITPGYPAYLALLMRSAETISEFNLWALNSQATLGTLSVILTFLLGRAAGGFGVGFGSSLLLAVSPHHIASNGYLLTETLFTFLVLAASWLTIINWQSQRRWMWFAIGIVAAMAALVRPVLLIFPLVIAIPMLLLRFPPKSVVNIVLYVTAGMIVINLPWIVWKNTHPAGPEPSLFATAVHLGGYPDLIYKDPALKGFPYQEDPEDSRGATTTGAFQLIAERAANEPARYLQWYLIGKPIMFWQAENLGAVGGAFIYPIIDSIYNSQAWAAWSMNTMMALHPWLALTAAISGAYIVWRALAAASSNPTLLLSATLMGTFTAVHMVLTPLQRYAYPVYPFAYVLAAFGIAKLVHTLATQLSRKSN